MNACTTSHPTSPQHGPRHGPTAATRSVGLRPETHPQCFDRRNRGALNRPAPACVCRGHRPRPAIRDEHRAAVRHPYGDRVRRIVTGDDVGLGAAPRLRSILLRDGNRRAVDLPNQQQALAGHPEQIGDSTPLTVIAPQLQVPGGEEVVGDFEQRPAPEDRTPRCLRPLETAARLGMDHEYSRAWVRRD